MVRFREIGASWLKAFDGDFGRFIHHEFRIDNALSNSEIDDINISIFPNPANNKILVSGDLGNSSEIILTDNIGRIVSITKIDKNNTSHEIDISRLSKGIYFVSIDGNKTIKKIVKQ